MCVDTSSGVMDAGRIVRYQGTLVDVTEKRAMEQQLRRQEEFRRHLLESFPDLILVLDLKGQYTFVSARIGELLGYGPEHLMGKNVEETENASAGTGRTLPHRRRPVRVRWPHANMAPSTATAAGARCWAWQALCWMPRASRRA